MEMEQNFLNKKLKTITAYYGELVLDGEEDSEDVEHDVNDVVKQVDIEVDNIVDELNDTVDKIDGDPNDTDVKASDNRDELQTVGNKDDKPDER